MSQLKNTRPISAKLRVRGQMALPKEVRDDLGVGQGDLIVFEKTDKKEWRIKGVNLSKLLET